MTAQRSNTEMPRLDSEIEPRTLPAWTDRAVLLYGPRKSGTTLLQNLHDGGDDIFVYPVELKIKYHLATVWDDKPGAVRQYFALANIFEKDIPNFDKSGYRKHIEKLDDLEVDNLRDLLRHDIYGVYEHVREGRPPEPKMWAFKEAGGRPFDIVPFWRALFMKGRVVMILRDPLMVIRGILTDRRRRGVRVGPYRLWLEVLDPIAILYQQFQLLDKPFIYALSYEDLVADTAGEMGKVCDFLGVDFSPVLAAPTIFGKPVVTSTASKKVHGVFKEDRRWYDDLTLSQRSLVWVFSRLIWFRYRRKRSGRRLGAYSDVIDEVRLRQKQGRAPSAAARDLER